MLVNVGQHRLAQEASMGWHELAQAGLGMKWLNLCNPNKSVNTHS